MLLLIFFTFLNSFCLTRSFVLKTGYVLFFFVVTLQKVENVISKLQQIFVYFVFLGCVTNQIKASHV